MSIVSFKSLGFSEYGWYAYADDDIFVLGDSYPHEGGDLYRGEFKENDIPYLNMFKRECPEAYNDAVNYFNSRPKKKTYKFAVSLCGGQCGGNIEVEAYNENSAYEKAMDHVVGKLVEAFPNLDIEYDVECLNPDCENED